MVKHIGVLAPLIGTVLANGIPPRPAEVIREIAPRQTDSALSQLLDLVDESGLTACLPETEPLVSGLPTVPTALLNDDLLSQALSQTTLALSDVCEFSITGTNGPEFTSFLPTAYSWYNEHSSQIASILSGCPSASQFVQTVEAFGSCSQASIVSAGVAASGIGSASVSVIETFSIETDTVLTTSTPTTTSVSVTETLSIETDTVVSTSAATTGTVSATETVETGTPTSAISSASSSVAEAQAPRETGLLVAAAAVAGVLGVAVAL